MTHYLHKFIPIQSSNIYERTNKYTDNFLIYLGRTQSSMMGFISANISFEFISLKFVDMRHVFGSNH